MTDWGGLRGLPRPCKQKHLNSVEALNIYVAPSITVNMYEQILVSPKHNASRASNCPQGFCNLLYCTFKGFCRTQQGARLGGCNIQKGMFSHEPGQADLQ